MLPPSRYDVQDERIPCHSEAGDGVSGLPSREYGLLDVPLDCHDLSAGWGKICYTRLPALWRVSSTEAHRSFIQVRVHGRGLLPHISATVVGGPESSSTAIHGPFSPRTLCVLED